MSGEYGVIPVSDYKDICDAVREKTHTDALMLPPEVAAKIRSINPTPTPGEWVRPDGWPDLDAVNLTGFDGVYLTYDLTKTEGYGWIGLYATTADRTSWTVERGIGLYATTADRTSWTVERGHLEAGQFVAERTEQVANGGYFREPLDDTYGTIQLWRVSASGHITELKFVSLTATNSSNMTNNLQPCVERVGRLPYVVNFSSGFGFSQASRCCGTMWMQHDKLLDVSSVTTLSNAWQNCYSLQSLDLSGWDTGSVTSLRDAWNSCYNLQSLNLSGWDVSSVTALQGAWQNCYSLQSLNLSGWGTGSVASMASAWAYCYNLQSLNLSGWDVSSVTTLQSAWNSCYSLQSLNLSGWDTGSVTTLQDAWKNCYSIVDYLPPVIAINHSYSDAVELSIASLLRIIDSLPVATGTRTLTLGQNNKLKLTAEQIAVATQKGWAVA